MSREGLRVKRYPGRGNGWRLVHEASGMPLGFNVRTRGQAKIAAAGLYSTGVDWTLSGAAVKRDPNWDQAVRVFAGWKAAADQCCSTRGEEHFSPYTYKLPGGRCSGLAGQPRRS
jgi:hypothetical protein